MGFLGVRKVDFSSKNQLFSPLILLCLATYGGSTMGVRGEKLSFSNGK